MSHHLSIFGLSKRESVDYYLQKLHWLKIEERIEFKVLLLAYKALNGLAPEYLADLLNYNHLSGSRVPSLQLHAAKKSLAQRAFTSYAPLLWNCLPAEISQSDRLNCFKNKLKTRLFRKSYKLLDEVIN